MNWDLDMCQTLFTWLYLNKSSVQKHWTQDLPQLIDLIITSLTKIIVNWHNYDLFFL